MLDIISPDISRSIGCSTYYIHIDELHAGLIIYIYYRVSRMNAT